MAVLIIALAALVVFPSEGMREFMKHSNGNAEYQFVLRKPCETGLRNSGYALVAFSSVTVKQKNVDGTVTEPVCE